MAKPKLESFPAIEESLAAKITKLWKVKAKDYIARIEVALKSGDEISALAVLNDISFDDILKKVDGYIDLQLTNAFLLGGSFATPTTSLPAIAKKPLPEALKAAKRQFVASLTVGAVNSVRELVATVIHNYTDLKRAAALLKQELSKDKLILISDPRLDAIQKADSELDALADALNAAVDGNGSGLVDISSNMTTSRLISYGFLSESQTNGATTYQVTEVLDSRICPFCQLMHGKMFHVEQAMAHLETVLSTVDPEAVKVVAPWPKQTKENMSKYGQMESHELASNGWNVPPYHPGCRGTLAIAGTVDPLEVAPVQYIPKIPDAYKPGMAGIKTGLIPGGEYPEAVVDLLDDVLTTDQIGSVWKAANSEEFNNYLRFCMVNTPRFWKAESPIACYLYDQGEVKKEIKMVDDAINSYVLEKDTTLQQIAFGETASDLKDMGQGLVGVIVHDPAFVSGVWLEGKYGAGAEAVQIYIKVKKGQKLLKVNGKVLFPSDSHFQVTKFGAGTKTDYLYVEYLEKPPVTAPKPSVPPQGTPKIEKPIVVSAASQETAKKTLGKLLVLMEKEKLQAHKNEWHDLMSGIKYNVDELAKKLKSKYGVDLYDKDVAKAVNALKVLISEEQKAEIALNKILLSNDPAFDVLKKSMIPGNALDQTNALSMDVLEIAKKIEAEIAAKKIVFAELAAKEVLNSGPIIPLNMFKRIGEKPGGSNPGGIYEHVVTKKKYIVKEMPEDMAYNEVLAGKLYNLMGVKAPELTLVDTGKGKWVASLMEDGYAADKTKLVAGGPGVYEGFGVDAYLSNWDAVGMEFDNIGFINGRAIRIDVGGSLRYRAQGGLKGNAFGDAVTEIETLRDSGMNRQAAEVFGKMTERQIADSLKNVLSVDFSKIEALVNEFGPRSIAERAKLVTILENRREYLRKLYKKLAPEVEPPATVPNARVTGAEYTAIKDSRVNGRAMMTDSDDIEEHEVLVHFEKDGKGESYAVATFKLRGAAYDKVAGLSVAPPKEHLAIKTTTLDSRLYRAISYTSADLRAGNPVSKVDMEWVEAANEEYVIVLDQLKKAVSLKQLPASVIVDFDRAYSDTLKALNAVAPKVGHVAKWPNNLMFARKDMRWIPFDPVPIDAKPKSVQLTTKYSRSFKSAKISRGNKVATENPDSVFEISDHHIGGTVRVKDTMADVVFYPTDAPTASFRGWSQIKIAGDSRESVEKIFAVLKELGIKSERTSALQEEELYLIRQIYARPKLYKSVSKKLEGMPSGRERLDAMKEWLTADLKLPKSIDSYAQYNPKGSFEAFGHGRVFYERLDYQLDPDWTKFEQAHVLFHEVTGGSSDLGKVMELILNGGGSMAPTLDKLRRGIPLGGMSPEEDLRTGGASYFFTRIMKKSEANRLGFVFKTKALLRADAISYDGDRYGNTETSENILRHRQDSVSKLTVVGEQGGSNETIFKGSFSLFDNLDYVLVRTESEKEQLVKKIKLAGYNTWPDGRKIEDIVKARGY